MDAEASDLAFFNRFVCVDFVPIKWVERIAMVAEADGDLVSLAEKFDEAAFLPGLNTTVFDDIGDEFLEDDLEVEDLLRRGTFFLAVGGEKRVEPCQFAKFGLQSEDPMGRRLVIGEEKLHQ